MLTFATFFYLKLRKLYRVLNFLLVKNDKRCSSVKLSSALAIDANLEG